MIGENRDDIVGEQEIELYATVYQRSCRLPILIYISNLINAYFYHSVLNYQSIFWLIQFYKLTRSYFYRFTFLYLLPSHFQIISFVVLGKFSTKEFLDFQWLYWQTRGWYILTQGTMQFFVMIFFIVCSACIFCRNWILFCPLCAVPSPFLIKWLIDSTKNSTKEKKKRRMNDLDNKQHENPNPILLLEVCSLSHFKGRVGFLFCIHVKKNQLLNESITQDIIIGSTCLNTFSGEFKVGKFGE